MALVSKPKLWDSPDLRTLWSLVHKINSDSISHPLLPGNDFTIFPFYCLTISPFTTSLAFVILPFYSMKHALLSGDEFAVIFTVLLFSVLLSCDLTITDHFPVLLFNYQLMGLPLSWINCILLLDLYCFSSTILLFYCSLFHRLLLFYCLLFCYFTLWNISHYQMMGLPLSLLFNCVIIQLRFYYFTVIFQNFIQTTPLLFYYFTILLFYCATISLLYFFTIWTFYSVKWILYCFTIL